MIPKSEAEVKWKENLEASAAALEGLVDIAIRGALSVPVRVETHTYDPKAVSLVAAKYEAHGWLVKAGNDQRDGPWLTLE